VPIVAGRDGGDGNRLRVGHVVGSHMVGSGGVLMSEQSWSIACQRGRASGSEVRVGRYLLYMWCTRSRGR